jgi:hypothetical protein
MNSAKKFRYEVPQGGNNRRIKITIIDNNGETEIFNAEREPGTKLEVPINPRGNAKARIFINGILVEEIPVD